MLKNEEQQPHWMDRFIIPIDSSFRKTWDIAQAFVLMYVAIMVPIVVGFSEATTGSRFVLDFCVDIYFWLDIIVNFISAYSDTNDDVVTDPRRIVRNYAKGWFSIDILASMPIEIVIRSQLNMFTCAFDDSCPPPDPDKESGGGGNLFKVIKILRLLRLAKMLRLVRIKRILDRYQDDLFAFQRFITIMKLMLTLLELAHLLGCLMFYMSGATFPSEDQRIADGT